jgi:putative oxidoreductase
MMLGQFLTTSRTAWHTIPLRLAVGSVFIGHGAQKLFGWFDGPGLQSTAEAFSKMGFSPEMALLAASGEFFGGLLVLLGLFTRLGALSVMIVMLVAIFKVHWGAFFMPKGIEYAFTLCLSGLSLLLSGGGALSIDALLKGKSDCAQA